MSWSPNEIGLAVERSAPTSLPACGSVRFIVPVQAPVARWGRYCACWSGVPWWISASIAPTVSVGQSAKPMLALPNVSSTAVWIAKGRPWPPKSSGTPIVPQPPST
ncbi:hypothetical protein WR25_03035 [Diploscapter pachys]|uniref:Uncharacterized protein n=1 Tax=Diploscapter pachys TaxID=2018661 RepID=A0A2A2M4H4_9BILA|nr:hypothetical protein WR25_03035 [Diploscapter pachys]